MALVARTLKLLRLYLIELRKLASLSHPLNKVTAVTNTLVAILFCGISYACEKALRHMTPMNLFYKPFMAVITPVQYLTH